MVAENVKEKATEPKPAKPGDSAKGTAAAGQGETPPKAPSADNARFEGFLAEIVNVETNRTGIYGEIKQALCKIMEGRDKGRVIRRNFSGRIKKGDIIRLPDTSREDKRIVAR